MRKMRVKPGTGLFCAVLVFSVLSAASCVSGNGYDEGPSSVGNRSAVSNGGRGTPPEGGPPQGSSRGERPPQGPEQGRAPSSAAELASRDSSDYFSDLDASTSWANAYVDYLYEAGIIVDEKGDGLFRANEQLTRAEAAGMLYRMYGYSAKGLSYEDVSTDAVYYDAAMRGKAEGIFGNTKYFYPDDPVSMETLALWIYKSEILKGMPQDMRSKDLSVYNDEGEISNEARTAVASLTGLGIFQPDLKGNFNPESGISRGKVSHVFYRLLFLGGGPGGGPGDRAPR